MPWPRDDEKLDRVRRVMTEDDVDVLVVRAPDNVLYLTNFWAMKGYDVAVFPRDGEPTLICLEASLDDAARNAWTQDVRPFSGYHPSDPRPPGFRSMEAAVAVARAHGGRVGLESSLGTSAADRMVGEPSGWTQAWFEAFPNAVDATTTINRARSIKSQQEIERIRLANRICADALDHVRANLSGDMREMEVGAMWNGAVHALGTGYENGAVELAHGFSLIWSGANIRTFTATKSGPIAEHEPTLFEVWVTADGYWCDHTKNMCPGELTPEYQRLLDDLTQVYDAAVAHCRPGASFAELDVLVRDGIAAMGYPGQPSHPICHGVGARAHEWPYAHQAGGGTIEAGMVLAIEPGCYWEGGGGLRLEDNWLITADGPEKLCPFPDGVVIGRG